MLKSNLYKINEMINGCIMNWKVSVLVVQMDQQIDYGIYHIHIRFSNHRHGFAYDSVRKLISAYATNADMDLDQIGYILSVCTPN